MARRGIPLSPGYVSGSHWSLCDMCGSQFRAEDLQVTWDNFWVCDEDFELRHPQDFLRVRPEVITVDDPVRPENTDNVIATTFESSSLQGKSAVVGYAVVGLAKAGNDLIPQGTFNNTI